MDLYALLGVPRTASAEAIERAYTRLARRYHPGINPGDRLAEQMYRQIGEAYAVLGSVERRRAYDTGAAQPVSTAAPAAVAFEGFDFTAPAEGPMAGTFAELFSDVFQAAAREAVAPSQGAAIEVTLQIPFEAAWHGGTMPLSIVRQDRCGSCQGRGRVQRPAEACPVCRGAGERQWVRGHMVFSKPCETCGGRGQLIEAVCHTCGGVGAQSRTDAVTVTVPAGVETGARLVVPGGGHAGARGGPAGDLYVQIEVAPHRWFKREGRDLRLTLPVAVHEAALGGRVDVPTPDGVVRMRIPPGTSSGRTFRLRGHGVPGPSAQPGANDAGDLIVEVQIVLPPLDDLRSRDLLREFGRLNPGDVRRHLFE